MRHVSATFTANKGEEEELKACLMNLVKACSHHKGMHTYRLHQNPSDPASFFFYEQFEDDACLKEHADSPELIESAPVFQKRSAAIAMDVWNPLAESGSPAVHLGRQRLAVSALLTAHKGKEEELKTCLMDLVKACAHHKGMHTYRLHQNAKKPAQFLFYEQFENETYLKEHSESPEFSERAPLFQTFAVAIEIKVWTPLAESGSSCPH